MSYYELFSYILQTIYTHIFELFVLFLLNTVLLYFDIIFFSVLLREKSAQYSCPPALQVKDYTFHLYIFWTDIWRKERNPYQMESNIM